MRFAAVSVASVLVATTAVWCDPVEAVPRFATGYCAVANRLSAADPAAARAALVKAALINPSAPCIANVQKRKLAPAPTPWKKSVENWVSDWTTLIGVLVLPALFALLIAGSLMALTTYSPRVRRFGRRVPGARRFFLPRVAMDALNDAGATGLGPGTAALIANALDRLARVGATSGRYTIDRASGVESASDTVAVLADLSPRFKALSVVLAFLGRAAALPRYKLSGALQSTGALGAGLTLTLNRRAHTVDGTTLWRVAGNATDAFQRLSIVAAGWVDCVVRRQEGFDDLAIDTSAASFAYFRAGVANELLERDDIAIEAYLEALHQDPTNAGALLNLGRLYDRRGDIRRGELFLTAALLAL